MSPPGFCDVCGRPEPCPFKTHAEDTEVRFGDPDPNGWDRSGVLGADGQVYSDADPGL